MEMSTYEQGKSRLTSTHELQPYADAIIAYFPEGDEHWDWIATGKIADIVDWAKTLDQGKAA